MLTRRRRLLQNIALFGALSPAALDFLLQRARSVSRNRGEYFFREGDQAQSVYVLESGRVSVIKRWQGEDFLLRPLAPGDCFGEMALMTMFPRSASVLAAEDATAFKIGAAALLELYAHDLEQFTLLQMNLGREVCRRLRDADERAFHCLHEKTADRS
jgi:CRP/FNR family cyclic AMP-dependent transcriptional regulator